MRNLKEYPVTREETVKALTKASLDLLNEQRAGDMRPLLLSLAAEFIFEYPTYFEEFLEKKNKL